MTNLTNYYPKNTFHARFGISVHCVKAEACRKGIIFASDLRLAWCSLQAAKSTSVFRCSRSATLFSKVNCVVTHQLAFWSTPKVSSVAPAIITTTTTELLPLFCTNAIRNERVPPPSSNVIIFIGHYYYCCHDAMLSIKTTRDELNGTFSFGKVALSLLLVWPRNPFPKKLKS